MGINQSSMKRITYKKQAGIKKKKVSTKERNLKRNGYRKGIIMFTNRSLSE